MFDLKSGVKQFQENIFPQHAKVFESLAGGQSPSVLMITCADSRVVPEMFTQSQPGDIFMCRNAGNMIPPYGSGNDGTVASIEFAIASFDIKTIVVCGHSDCGAMKGGMNKDAVKALPAIYDWLSHACSHREQNLEEYTFDNIQHQINHLMTYPLILEKFDNKEIDIQGWYFDIGTGQVTYLPSPLKD